MKSHNGTISVEIIFGTNTLLTDFYAIGSKSVLNISKVLYDRFRYNGIPINIWSNNSQEYFIGSVRKLLHAYVVGRKNSESQKHNQNPDERRIQYIKGTTITVLDHSVAPI